MKSNIVFVLVRPQFLGNIGATARVLKNFGFSDLRFVNAPREYKDSEARRMAVDAIDLLKNARLFDSLPSALADVGLALGTTCTRNRNIKVKPLEQCLQDVNLPVFAENNKVAFVFGDERDGLRNDELVLCHELTTIETNPDFSSLNLSMAVGLSAYEAARAYSCNNQSQLGLDEKAQECASTLAEIDEVSADIALLLDRVGFSRSYNAEKILAELRRFYQRALPTKRETDLLRGFVLKMNESIK
jgi:TrmH family RNA methyltransferase